MMPVLDTILLVDDDVTANFLHRRLLSRLQVAEKIVVVLNGDEALRYLQAHCLKNGNNECPKLIFLDIKMPIMDGIEFMEHYETMKNEFCCDIPIIVLSSSVNPKDTVRLQEFESVQHQYVKPLSEDMVNQIITQYFSA